MAARPCKWWQREAFGFSDCEGFLAARGCLDLLNRYPWIMCCSGVRDVTGLVCEHGLDLVDSEGEIALSSMVIGQNHGRLVVGIVGWIILSLMVDRPGAMRTRVDGGAKLRLKVAGCGFKWKVGGSSSPTDKSSVMMQAHGGGLGLVALSLPLVLGCWTMLAPTRKGRGRFELWSD